MELAYKKMGSGQPLIILHGLFGMSDNWMTIGRMLEKNMTIFIPDQRNHGTSPKSNDFNYQLLAEDVHEFILTHRLEGCNLLGHSMGGKAAMVFMTQNPSLIKKLIIADMAPRIYSNKHFSDFIQALMRLDLSNLTARQEADQILSAVIPQVGIRQFLLKNLYRDENDRFQWRINLESIYHNLSRILEAVLIERPILNPTLFIHGGKSDYITDADKKEIVRVFSNVRFAGIPAASHWLHADAPDKFSEIVRDFLIHN
jgi:pimeloyl-ACP methyl ester carboxylesterase